MICVTVTAHKLEFLHHRTRGNEAKSFWFSLAMNPRSRANFSVKVLDFVQCSGLFHTCGIQNGSTILCWENDTSGQATPPRGGIRDLGEIH